MADDNVTPESITEESATDKAPQTPQRTTAEEVAKPTAAAAAAVPDDGNESSGTPSAAASAPAPAPHAPSPAAVAAKRPHIPSPTALAAKGTAHHPAPTGYSDSDVKRAEGFGRVAEDGTVYVREGDGERTVGQFPDATAQEALSLYARRFLDLKAKVDLFATRLENAAIKPREIDDSLRALREETEKPEAVGDIAALRADIERLAARATERKNEIGEARRQAMAKAVAERTEIVHKAEEIASSLDDSTNWRQTADRFRSLFEQWQQHQRTSIRIDKADADVLWKRFSAARTTFNQARRHWAQQRDAERATAKNAKEQIIREADALKDSTEWGETSRRFNELMDRWKQAGRAGRTEDDALWARFREAADVFFAARQADRDQTDSSERENLAAKETLLVKAEALLPVADEKAAKKARKALAAIQEQWDQIGYVPREDIRRIEGRLDAVDRQIKAVEEAAWTNRDPESDARRSSFEEQLTVQLAELDKAIASETDPKRRASLEAEKATKQQWLDAVR